MISNRMETKLEIHESRILQVERSIERLSKDMATVKCDVAILKSLMAELRTGLPSNKRLEEVEKQVHDSLVPKGLHMISQVGEIEKHIDSEIEVEDNDAIARVELSEEKKFQIHKIQPDSKGDCRVVGMVDTEPPFVAEYVSTTIFLSKSDGQMKLTAIHGRSEPAIIDDYTWEQFFQEGLATKASHWSRSLFFTLSRTEAVAESSQGNWILLRANKAHWGRSPIFKPFGLDYDGQMAQIITHYAASFTQRTETWCLAETRMISLNPPFAMSAASVGQLVQVAEAAADYFSISESYGVLCLVLGENGTEFSGMASTLWNPWRPPFLFYSSRMIKLAMEDSFLLDKREEIELASLIRMNIARLIEQPKSTGVEKANRKVLLGFSVFAQLWLLVARSLPLFCLLRGPDTLDREVQNDIPRAFSLSSIVSLVNVQRLIEWVDQERLSKGIMLPDSLGTESMNANGLVLSPLIALSKPNNPLVWIVHGAQDPVTAAMAIKKGGLWPLDFVFVEWVQTGIIHLGWKILYYCFVNDVWAPLKRSKDRFTPPRHFVAGLFILLYPLRVPGTTVADMLLIATCSMYCWLGLCIFLVTIIVEKISVKIAKLLTTAIPDLVETCIKSFDVKKQKLTSTFTYHLEDKVALNGGGNDGHTSNIRVCDENHVSEGICGISYVTVREGEGYITGGSIVSEAGRV